MALSDEKKTKRGAGSKPKESNPPKGDRDVGHALRSVYSVTVNEDIPPDLLDLLGKLN